MEPIEVLTSEKLLEMVKHIHRTPWTNVAAVFVSPEFYFDHNESLHGDGKAVETPRLPWQAFYGVPIIVDPDLYEEEYTVINAHDIIQKMRVAMDDVSDAMIGFAFTSAETNAHLRNMLPQEVTYDI